LHSSNPTPHKTKKLNPSKHRRLTKYVLYEIHKSILSIDTTPHKRVSISHPDDIHKVVVRIWNPTSLALLESYLVFYLDHNNCITSYHAFDKGAHGTRLVDHRQIIQTALNLGLSSFIVCRNCKKGLKKPDLEEVNLIKKLRAIGLLLSIPLYAYAIVNKGAYLIAD